MRLTLRTLLAWLDDKLQPDQVSEIGKQVADSPLAQDLVQRIHRVTRQRRLTVPSKNGPDATDPNLVASYLDNDLDPEKVAEYEKKCFTSDVNLAEAASVHQILSNLGQKVQVPPEAKARMYLLVKGREAHPVHLTDGPVETAEPREKPIAPWMVQPPPRRLWLERFGPLAAFVALFGLLCWSAFESLKSDDVPARLPESSELSKQEANASEAVAKVDSPQMQLPGVAALDAHPDAEQIAKNGVPLDEADDEEMPGPPSDAPNADLTKSAAKDAEPKDREDATTAQTIPEGAVGVVAKVEGMLLDYNTEIREWERMAEGAGVNTSERLLVLPPFRARITTGKTDLDILPDSEVQLVQKAKDEDPALEIAHGRVLIAPSSSATSLHCTFGGRTIDMQIPAGATVGLELMNQWTYGKPRGNVMVLAVHAANGEITLSMDKTKEKLVGPGTILANSTGIFERQTAAKSPDWLIETQPSEQQAQVRESYLKQFSSDRPVLADIASATDNDDVEMKRLAISGLRALGDLSFLTPILDRRDDPSARQATMAALRDQLSVGGQSASRALDQLQLDFGASNRIKLEKLFLGFNDEDAAKATTFQELVDDLSPRNESLGIRELAFDNLKRLSGRTTIPYDADRPEPGYNAWRKLLEEGELHAAPKSQPSK